MANLERFKQVKAILADWDDTKVGTFPRIAEIVDDFAGILGVERPGQLGLLEFWGRTVEEIIHGLFGKHRPHLSSKELLEHHIATMPPDYRPNPIAGVEQAVIGLNEMGYIQGIVSSGPKKGILRDIRAYYPSLEEIYSFIHGAEDLPVRKPDPRVFDQAFGILKPLGITEAETVYIGDFHGDHDAAIARGMLFLGIEAHHKSIEWFKERGLENELRFSTFSQIPDFFENLHRGS